MTHKALTNVIAAEKANPTTQMTHHAIHELKKAAEEQLYRLKNQKKNMTALQSNLNIILTHYESEQSYLNQASLWLGNKKWWVKLLLSISIIGLAAAIGAVLQMMVIIILITSILYSATFFLLINHHTKVSKQNVRLQEDIIDMEQSLKETINHLSALEARLDGVLIALCEKNSTMATNLEQLEIGLAELQNTLQGFIAVNQSLEKTNSTLTGTAILVGESLEQSTAELTEYTQIISNEPKYLNGINAVLNETNAALAIGEQDLQTVCENFHTNTAQIAILANNVQNLLSMLTIKAHENQTARDALHLKLEDSVTQICESQSNTKDTIAHAEQLLSIAMKTLDSNERAQSKQAPHTQKMAAEITCQTKNNRTLLSQITALLHIGNVHQVSVFQ